MPHAATSPADSPAQSPLAPGFSDPRLQREYDGLQTERILAATSGTLSDYQDRIAAEFNRWLAGANEPHLTAPWPMPADDAWVAIEDMVITGRHATVCGTPDAFVDLLRPD